MNLIKKSILCIFISGVVLLTACENNTSNYNSSIEASESSSVTTTTLLATITTEGTTETKIPEQEISGFDITIEDLQPIIAKTCKCEYLISRGGDNYFEKKDGILIDYEGQTFDEFIKSFYDVYSAKSHKGSDYISSLFFYEYPNNELEIIGSDIDEKNCIEIDIFNIPSKYESVYFDGGSGANPTYLKNEFEIINRTETTLTLKNTAYYTEENSEPIQVFEYNMVLEDGLWKFDNFELWY